MKLDKLQINKFQKLYRREYGKSICFEEAQEELLKIIDLTLLIYRPLKKCEIKKQS